MIYISGHLYPPKPESGYLETKEYLSVHSCGFQKPLTHDLIHERSKGRLDYQLIYIAKGSGLFHLDGKKKITEGSMVLYQPGHPQIYSYFAADNPEVYWVHFSGYGVTELLERAGLRQSSVLHPGIDSMTIHHFKQIINELQLQGFLFAESANNLFRQLIVRVGRLCHQERDAVHQEASQMAISTMKKLNAHYNENFSVKEEARKNNISPCRFILHFKKVIGLSPLQYLINMRMEKAKELLLSTSLNVAEIADIVGYDNPLYFSRLFKKIMGVAPSSIRKNIK